MVCNAGCEREKGKKLHIPRRFGKKDCGGGENKNVGDYGRGTEGKRKRGTMRLNATSSIS